MVKKRFLLLILVLLQLQTVLAEDNEWWNDSQYVRNSLTLLIPDWESVWAKYSNNGSLGVEVYKDGQKLESYECAVYDHKGEQRECKSSLVDQGYGLGRCMLTIKGDYREEMHFKVAYDDENGVICVASVSETFSYYTNCTEFMTLHIIDEPMAFASLPDGSTYEFTSATCSEKVTNFPATTSIIFTGEWTSELLAGIKAQTADRPASEMNPNCLYFFPAHISVPEGWHHAIQGGKALGDIKLEDGQYPFLCPMDINLNGHRATYTRSWAMADGKSGWNTLCVPFKAKVWMINNDDDGSLRQALDKLCSPTNDNEPSTADAVEVPTFGSFQPSLSEWERGYGMWLCRVDYATADDGIVGAASTVEGVIEPNSPYLLTFPGEYFQSGSYSLDMTGSTIYLQNLTQTLPKTPSELTGSWQQTEKDDYTYQGNYRVMRSQNVWLLKQKAVSEEYDAFVRYTSGNLLPFRGYFNIPTHDPAPAKSVLGMSWIDVPDGIENVNDNPSLRQAQGKLGSGQALNENDEYYNINGVRINEPSTGQARHRIIIRRSHDGKTTKILQ